MGKTTFTPPIVSTNSIAGGPFPSSAIHELDEDDSALDLKKLDIWHCAQLKGVKEKRLLGGNPSFTFSLIFVFLES